MGCATALIVIGPRPSAKACHSLRCVSIRALACSICCGVGHKMPCSRNIPSPNSAMVLHWLKGAGLLISTLSLSRPANFARSVVALTIAPACPFALATALASSNSAQRVSIVITAFLATVPCNINGQNRRISGAARNPGRRVTLPEPEQQSVRHDATYVVIA